MPSNIFSSPIVKFWLNDPPSLFFALFLQQFIVHDGDHFVRFRIVRHPPILLSTITSFLNWFSLIPPLLLVLLYTCVFVHPVYLVFLAFVCVRTVFMRLSLWVGRVVVTVVINRSFQLLYLFFVVIVFGFKFVQFLVNTMTIFFCFLYYTITTSNCFLKFSAFLSTSFFSFFISSIFSSRLSWKIFNCCSI